VNVKARKTGRYVTVSTRDEPFKAFVPDALPPRPPIVMDSTLERLHGEAQLALGRLDGIVSLLPAPEQFLYAYVRKEAVASSQIEGTQSSLSDLLAYEITAAQGIPVEDVREVSDCVAAYEHADKRMTGGFPLSLRLICEAHKKLLARGRGKDQSPGQFRRSQNWIGGSRPGYARFVPPPADEVLNCMGELEKFLHDDPVKTPPLIKAALAHVQFETIHPFLDGNGRLGRLLVPLFLVEKGLLGSPNFYISAYIDAHRDAYYERLLAVSRDDDWTGWCRFFLTALIEQSRRNEDKARAILALYRDRKDWIAQATHSQYAVRALDWIFARPIFKSSDFVETAGIPRPTANRIVRVLREQGMLRDLRPAAGRRAAILAFGELINIAEGREVI